MLRRVASAGKRSGGYLMPHPAEAPWLNQLARLGLVERRAEPDSGDGYKVRGSWSWHVTATGHEALKGGE